MTSALLLALASIVGAVAAHQHTRWQSPNPAPKGTGANWSAWLAAALLLVAASAGAHCGGAP